MTDETITGVLHIEKGAVVRDNISTLQDNKICVVRDNSKTLSFLLDEYLEGVHELYLELKDRQHEFGIGIEHSPEGSLLGHYLTV
jgi:hypothetical protein